MANAEKGLEEVLMEIGNRLLVPPFPEDELLPLLDQAETLLSRVEQSPSESMSAALDPAMKGLTAKGLLGHPDADVRVSVAACISEITRITAPEAPYNDDVMKEIFQMIVEAFESLDDMNNSAFSKRVSILETVAKVRSCVVMLDLECDALIIDMFNHFLKTIRDSHPDNVFSSMEMIMTVVLEESEDISSDLLSCLLTSVKKNSKDTSPVARRLAEKVIGNCALKLKPYLVEAVQSLGAPLDDYSEIITSICEENSGVVVHNGINIPTERLADDSNLPVRTVSDGLSKGSGKLDSEVVCPEEVGNSANKSPKSAMSNGILLTGNGDSLAEPTSPNKKSEDSGHNILSKHTGTAGGTDKVDSSLDHSTKEAKGQTSDSEIQSTEITDHSRIVSDKDAVESINLGEGSIKEANTSQPEGATVKGAQATVLEVQGEKKELRSPSVKSPHDNAATSTTPSEKSPETGRRKRGRPSGSRSSLKISGLKADVPDLLSGVGKSSVNENIRNEALPSADTSSKKQAEGISDSEPKTLKRSVKKGTIRDMDERGRPSADSRSKMETDVASDLEGKLLRGGGSKPRTEKVSEGGTSGKRQASKTKQQKGKVPSENNAVSEPTPKGKVHSHKADAKADRDENRSLETPKMKSQKKRAREKEILDTPRDALQYDETLIGAKIKVWWPDDKQFYHGVVASYESASKRHKVLYIDGDEEVLLLKDEVFEFLKSDDEDEEEKENATPATAAGMPRKKAKLSDSVSKKTKVVTSPKGGGGSSVGRGSGTRSESGGKHEVHTAKLAGGRRGSTSKSRDKTDDSTPTGSRKKDKASGGSGSAKRKTGAIPKDELGKTPTDRSPETTTTPRDETLKPGSSKSKDGTPKTGSKPKNSPKMRNASKDGTPKAGSQDKDASSRSGTESKDDVTKNDSKSNEGGKSRGKQKLKGSSPIPSGKSDANGTSLKGKTGSLKGHKSEEAASNINSDAGISQESEERRGKKRRK